MGAPKDLAVLVERYRVTPKPRAFEGRSLPNLADWAQRYPDFEYRSLPELVPRGHCRVCGKPLSTRRYGFCEKDRHGRSVCRSRFARTVYGVHWLKRQVAVHAGLRCERCGKEDVIRKFGGAFPALTFEMHHVVPVEMGGDTVWENLAYVCGDCHREVHAQIRATGELWVPDRLAAIGARELLGEEAV